jgi:protein-glutamine gamma-glutamyltransferase
VKVFFLELGQSMDRFVGEVIGIARSPEKLFSAQGGLVAFVLMLLVVALTGLVRKLNQFVRSLLRGGGSRAKRRRQVEFYERFLALCEKQRLVKQPSQTPREFAGQVTRVWNDVLARDGFGQLPSNIVERFYDIRYGDRILPPEEERALVQTLTRLEQAFSPRRGNEP